jgi:hypothetical protein
METIPTTYEDARNYGCHPKDSVLNIQVERANPAKYYFPGTPTLDDFFILFFIALAILGGLFFILFKALTFQSSLRRLLKGKVKEFLSIFDKFGE